jgi:hypothetical protein
MIHFMMIIIYYYLVANMKVIKHCFLDLMLHDLEILPINLGLLIPHLLFNAVLLRVKHQQMMNH